MFIILKKFLINPVYLREASKIDRIIFHVIFFDIGEDIYGSTRKGVIYINSIKKLLYVLYKIPL